MSSILISQSVPIKGLYILTHEVWPNQLTNFTAYQLTHRSFYRFIVGPYEQIGYTPGSPEIESPPKQFSSVRSRTTPKRTIAKSSYSSSTLYRALTLFCHCVKEFKNYLKTVTKCQYCSHPDGCVHYWLQVSTTCFSKSQFWANANDSRS